MVALQGILGNLKALFASTWQTIDPDRRERINQVWAQQELRIVNTSAPIDSTPDMMVVPRSAVVYMAQQLQQNDCSICMGGNSDRKDCKFRRAMIDLAIPDLRREEKRSGKCVGKLFNWAE